jgi:PAS domain-containing protein
MRSGRVKNHGQALFRSVPIHATAMALTLGLGLAAGRPAMAQSVASPEPVGLIDQGRQILAGWGVTPDMLAHPLFAAGLALAILLPLFAVLLWSQARRRGAAEREADSLADQTEALRRTLDAGRDGYLLWLPERDAPIISRRLSIYLDLPGGTESSVDQVLEAMGSEHAPALTAAIQALRDQGTPFSLRLAPASPQQRPALSFRGLRVLDDTNAAGPVDVVWCLGDAEPQPESATEPGTDGTLHRLALLRGALDALPEPVWVRDSDLTPVFCNTAFAAAVDAPDADAALAMETDLATGDTARELRALAARSRAASRPLSGRYHIVMAGARRPVQVLESPFRLPPDEDGDLYTVGVARDASPLEDLENRLSNEQGNNAVVLEHLSTAIAIFGPEKRLVYYNPAFARLWRLDAAWLDDAQPSYGELLDLWRDRRALPEVPDYPAFRAAEMERFAVLREPMQDLAHLPDGKTLRRVIAPQPDGGLLLTYEDVTDKLTLERSFNTLSAVQRETLDHLHEAVGVFGADGRLKLANPAFAALWGETAANMDSPPQMAEFLDLLRDRFADESSWRHHRFAVLSPPSQRTQHRGRVSITDGMVLDYACVPLPDGGLLLSYNDISDTARIEQALRERAQSLSAASMLRSDFIASLSYELRTPLTTIAGFSEMLCAEYHGNLNAQQIDYSQSIAETARDLVVILDDIADLVTIEAGRSALDVDTFDVCAAVGAVVTLSREMTRRRAVSLDLDCPEALGWMVGDESRIKQIVFHLVGSAIRSSPAGSRVAVTVRREQADEGAGEDAIVLSVSDEAGQASARTLSSGPGLSRGGDLAMLLVRRFAEMHGGSIVVSARPELGTTITCRLPTGRVETEGTGPAEETSLEETPEGPSSPDPHGG